MKILLRPAFGYVVIVVDFDIGEKRSVASTEDGFTSSGNYFLTKGTLAVCLEETGEVLENRVAGWLNTEHTNAGSKSRGTFNYEAIEESQWLCIPLSLNGGSLPNLSSLVLSPGESAPLSQGTNVYLVRGSLDVNGKLFTGPTQIRIRSVDLTATCLNETSYSLKFL